MFPRLSRTKKLLSCLALGLVCLGASTAGRNVAHGEIIQAMQSVEYRLGVNDVLDVTVYDEQDLSGSYQVKADGSINMPLIGAVIVAGFTADQAQTLIENELADGYLINPDVSIEIAKYRSFYIMGEVKNPGQYEYEDNITALSAVAKAGGFTYRAKKKYFKILRKGTMQQQENYKKVETSAALAPGDILLVEERFF